MGTESEITTSQVYALVYTMRGELTQFRHDTLRRLDTLEHEDRTDRRERSCKVFAFISAAAAVFSCISNFIR